MSSVHLMTSIIVLLGSGAAALADQAKLHPVETYTVVYKQAGATTGTHTVHSRDFGRKRAELADVVVTLRGLRLPMKARTVIEGERMTSIDDETGQSEISKDPTYAASLKAMAGGGAVETIMKTVWKATATGKTKRYAGESCSEYVSADKRHRYCATADGILLYINQGGNDVRFERTAIEVRRNDGGADAAFEVSRESTP